MGPADIKKHLKTWERDKLVSLVLELYKANKAVKEYVDHLVAPDERGAFNKYRDKVLESFYPKRGMNYSLKDGKKAISDFKKLGPSPILLADLMLFYVETGVSFTNDFGDINESFYSSLEKTYDAALKLMRQESLLDRFADRAAKVVDDTRDIGWGFHDYLSDAYSEYYRG